MSGSGWAAKLAGPGLDVMLDPAEGYALTQLVHRASRFNFAAGPAPKLDRSPWLLHLRRPDGTLFSLSANDAASAGETSKPGGFTVTWIGVGVKSGGADLTVAVEAEGRGEATAWRIRVHGQAPGALWQVDFPRLALRPVGEDFLAIPHYLGRLKRDPVKHPYRFTGSYPSPMSMQFMAGWGTPGPREPQAAEADESGWRVDRGDAAGLVWAAADRDFHYKLLSYDTATVPGVLQAWFGHVPPVDKWPLPSQPGFRIDYQLPYDVVLQPFRGDAFQASAIYRGLDLAGPSRKPAGTADPAYTTPEWFRNVGFWAKFYQEPAKVVPEWAAYAKWLRVPIASHYYRGTIAAFDDNYPEMLPVDPYYIGGIRDAKDMGVFPMPYTNGVIWDRDTQSYLRENGAAAAIKDEAGNLPVWDIHGESYSYMCPYTEQWQDKVGDTAYRQIVEHGTAGVYLDCLTATRAYLCYDPRHGHSLHGGNYYAQGQRRMMQRMRSGIRKVNPDACFFPEMCGEWLIDLMDGYLNLDISRSAPPPGEQVFPLFNLVYHQDTINFGDDAAPQYDPARHAWEMGHMLVWGAQPLYSAMIATPPKAGEANAEMLRDLVQAYYVAGRPFLRGGKAVPLVLQPPGKAPASGAPLSLASAPHQLTYELRKGVPRRWQGPAVLGSAWRTGNDLGVVLCNISTNPQEPVLSVQPEALGLRASARLVRTWPEGGFDGRSAAGEHRLQVPARRVAFYVLTDDPSKAPRGGKLLEPAWELLTAENAPFEPLQGKAGSLWASSDGPVANTLQPGATRAVPVVRDANGAYSARQGVRPKLREGEALPRDPDKKPFALLRPLLVTAEGEGTVVVMSGDEHHVLCLAPGDVKLRFAQAGLLTACGESGRAVRGIGAGKDNAINVPASEACYVGYAVPEALPRVVEYLGSCDEETRKLSDALSETVEALAAKPEPGLLARASRQLAELERGLGELPGAFVPGTPLQRLHLQIQALVSGQLGGSAHVTAPHDWLAPGLPLEGSFAWTGRPDGTPELRAALIGRSARSGVSLANSGPDGRTWAWTAHVEDPGALMRLVPLLITADMRQAGQTYVLSSLALKDANAPVELQTPAIAATAVAGKQAGAELVLRNWSPYDLRMRVNTQAPQGWDIAAAAGQPPGERIDVPASRNTPVKLRIGVPDTAKGPCSIEVRASYTGGTAGGELLGEVLVNVQPRLLPLIGQAGSWTEPAPAETARIRRHAKLVGYAGQGETLVFTIRNSRVSHYTDTLNYRLLDPELRVVRQGRLAVDKTETLTLKAGQEGAHFLEVEPGSGSVMVTSGTRPFAEMATKAEPLHLFTCPLTRFFHVPAGAKAFRLGAQDGGADETALFRITSPTGRVAFERGGNHGGAEYGIEVRPEEAGKTWILRVEPRQDLAFWLAGEANPYLSTAPERVIVEAAGR